MELLFFIHFAFTLGSSLINLAFLLNSLTHYTKGILILRLKATISCMYRILEFFQYMLYKLFQLSFTVLVHYRSTSSKYSFRKRYSYIQKKIVFLFT